jgi:glycosyltransferase involved in cell wall biosynthesis
VRLFFDYARGLAGEFDVAVFTSDARHDLSRLSRTEVIDGVPVSRHRLWLRKLAAKSIHLLSPSLLLEGIRRIRASTGVVIIHISELRGAVPLYAVLLKRLFRRRTILVHSAFGSLHYKASLRRRIYDKVFTKLLFNAVDLRLAQNDHEKAVYSEWCRQYGISAQANIRLFPLHLDGMAAGCGRLGAAGKNRQMVAEVRMQYGVPQDARVFIFLGRLHVAKGILRAIDVFLEFARRVEPNSMLLIVGADYGFQQSVERYILERNAGERVRVVNNVYETRFDYYFLADVFLGFPTIFEETMLSSVEAMGCGTPIIVSREADAPFVEEEGAGHVIDFDVNTAVEAMAAVVRQLPDYEVRAHATAARHFSGASAAPALLALLREAAASHSDAGRGVAEVNEHLSTR